MTFDKVTLEVAYENAIALLDRDKVDPKEFAMIRRNGFGASDAAVLLNVSPFTGITDLIAQKASTEVTAEELAIGELTNVRIGVDLEDLIIEKFVKWSGMDTHKPEPMYRIIEHPQLTVNFDGITESGIPVEAKYVSMYGEGKKGAKYWHHDRAMASINEPPVHRPIPTDRMTTDKIKELADDCGIPVYYYTQCQQQILSANSEYCYLAALHHKDWTLRVYHVPRCEAVITALKTAAYMTWKQVETKKIKNSRL